MNRDLTYKEDSSINVMETIILSHYILKYPDFKSDEII